MIDKGTSMRKAFRFISVVFLLPILFVSCSHKKTVKEETGPIKIGFSSVSDTYLLERWNRDQKIFTSTARSLGAEINVQVVPGNAGEQVKQIQYLMDQDIDVLVVIPQDMEILAGIIKKVQDKGIPVLAYDRPIMGVPISGYISFDNQEVGRLFSKALLDRVPEGDYLIVNGSIRDNNSFEVNSGVYEVLNPAIQSGAVNIIEEIWLDEWSFDEALEKIEVFLDSGKHVDAISAANDQIADAAIRLLSERQLAGKVAVVGQDADLLSCQRVVEGTQLMTVYKPIPRLASRAAELAVAFGKGQFPEPDRIFDNGTDEGIPYYIEIPVGVFKAQMDATIIKDGFHSREDVYRNVGN